VGAGWRVLAESQRVTRLGEGQARAGRLVEAAMRRTIETVTEFVAAAERAGASDVTIVATSAVRDAANRGEFVTRVESATRRGVRVVSGEEEARLALGAVTASLPHLGAAFVLVDVGGGSTEFVVSHHGDARLAVSLRLGVV